MSSTSHSHFEPLTEFYARLLLFLLPQETARQFDGKWILMSSQDFSISHETRDSQKHITVSAQYQHLFSVNDMTLIPSVHTQISATSIRAVAWDIWSGVQECV